MISHFSVEVKSRCTLFLDKNYPVEFSYFSPNVPPLWFDDGGPLANDALGPCSAARLQGYGGPNAGGLPILVQLLTDPPLLPLHQVEAASITGRRRLLLERSRRSMWCMILRSEQCRSGSHRPKWTPGARRDRDFARDHARNPEIASDCTTPINRFLSGSWVKAEEAKKTKRSSKKRRTKNMHDTPTIAPSHI